MSAFAPSRRALAAAALLAALTVAGYLALARERDSFGPARGDEGTYLAMAESLAFDLDLRFDDRDADRLRAADDPGRQAVILQRAGGRIAYSKPTAYALLAAPFYRFAGSAGLVLLNLAALAAAAWCGWVYLRRFAADRALLSLVAFAGAGALPAYVAWRTSDLAQVACVFAGLALSLGPLPRRGLPAGAPRAYAGPAAAILGGLLIGLAAAMRITNLAMAAAPIGALLLERRRARSAWVALGIVALLAGGAGANRLLTGAVSPYRAVRATFDPVSGYPGTETRATAPIEDRFETAFSQVRLRSPSVRPAVTAYASLYFLIGRNSGLLLYAPMALVLTGAALARRDRTAIACLAAAGGLTAFYLLWMPHNYFGGGASVGNRYFLVAYAALPFAAARPPRLRWTAAAWALAAAALISAILSTRGPGRLDPSSQSHVHAGLFRMLPYESTANNLEGNRERFWPSDPWELVRFADPFAEVGDWSFRLSTERPAAEIEIANLDPDAPLRFLVLSPTRRLELVYRDWRGTRILPLRRKPELAAGVVIEPAPAWRRHPLWFWWMLRDTFHLRVFRLGLRTPDGAPAEADVRYLGALELPGPKSYRRTVLDLDLPATAVAGGTTTIPLVVCNDGDRPWTSEEVLPVYVGYRLRCPESGIDVEGARFAIEDAVAPGESLRSEIEVRWPEVAGACELTVDLLVEGIAWFASETGEPLGRTTVDLRAP